ncbi:SPOR domain-containing protein [Marinomonas sp. M1K-6]|uniref:SPOR domain-containing protein n=1 Tax=Marinomonas profundi TaxID=2726122 RepID=A0A847R3P8_9GAMM|nr:SPOR domain-containing protein [Marinomonas profundi]NLQ18552.1 SPOR domain-containing protein [Marinomonas profundi]UDV04424.1 SPOR domain-containing protein [Marinomonas profundi]
MFNPMQIATKGSRPRKGATRRTPPPPKRKTTWWLWLLVPAILIAFVYGLTQLSQVPAAKKPAQLNTSKPESKNNTESNRKPESKSKPAPTNDAVKLIPQDTFDFYQILQDSKVDTSHVEAYQSTPRGEQNYYYMLQAASFRNPEDADRMRAQLILSGLVETSVNKTTVKDNQPWYRVVLGPYDSRSKMNRAEDKLVSMEISPYSYKVDKEQ